MKRTTRRETGDRRTDRRSPSFFARRDTWIVLGAASIARLWHLVEYSRLPWFRVLQMDARYHADWANRLVNQGWHDPEPFFRAPLYPYMLALLQSLTGEILWSARLLQVALGIGTVLLAYAIALRLLPRRWALAAGCLAALIWTPIHYETELLLESTFTFLTTLLLYVVVKQGDRAPGSRALAAWGLVGGLAAAARPNILVFLPFLPLYAAALRRQNPAPGEAGAGPVRQERMGRPAAARSFARAALRASVPFAAGCIIPILPIWLHNARSGDPGTILAWQGGINFYIGNNPSSNGWSAIAPGMRMDWKGGYDDALRLARERTGKALSPAGISDYWMGEGLRFWREQPGQALRLLGLKCALFWSSTEIKNNEDPRFFRQTMASLRWIPVSFGLLAPFALVGLWLAWRRGSAWRLLAIFTLAWFVSVVPFFVCARYRLPITPLLPLFAVLAALAGLQWFRARRWSVLAGGAVLLAGLYAFVFTAKAGTEAGGLFQSWCNLGDVYSELGRWREAEPAYRRAIELAPKYVASYNNLGLALEKMGRMADAETAYRNGLTVQPDHPLLRQNLGLALESQGKLKEAEGVFRSLYEAHPEGWDSGMYMARVQEAMGEATAARQTYAGVLDRFPGAVPARVRLAQLQAQAGDSAAARATVQAGLRLNPSSLELRKAQSMLGLPRGLRD